MCLGLEKCCGYVHMLSLGKGHRHKGHKQSVANSLISRDLLSTGLVLVLQDPDHVQGAKNSCIQIFIKHSINGLSQVTNTFLKDKNGAAI